MDDSKDTKESPTKEVASNSGVKVPEEFQKQVDALVSQCKNKEMISYLTSCCYTKQSEMESTDKPSEYTTADEPND